MKQLFTQTFFTAALFLSGIANAQTNSVELKDGTGALISSYTSITAAYAAIPASLTQAYTIELTNTYNGSTETFPIVFIAKTGASAANSITLRPAAGVTTMSIQATVTSNPVLRLNDADYVTIDGRPGGVGAGVLKFNNFGTGYDDNTIQLINGACFNTIRNCTIMNSAPNTTGKNIYISSSTNASGNSDNTFKYCEIVGGRYQVSNSGTAGNNNTRNTIFGCDFKNPRFVSYWGQSGSSKIRIDSCSISSNTPFNESLYFGILFDSQTDSAIIVNNRFYDLQVTNNSTIRYIHVRTTASTGTNVVDIRNNFFSMMTGNTAVTNLAAIELNTGTNLFAARVAHNSFRVGGTLTSGGSAGNAGSGGLLISATNAASAFEVLNNLFVNERTGGTTGLQHLGMWMTSATPAYTISGNTYNSTSGNLVRWGATAYNTIPSYQAVVPGGEPTANDFPVQYVSANNLHIACAAVGSPSLMTNRIANITTDIDGDLRGSTTYRGADESSAVSMPTVTLAGQSNISCNGLTNGSATVTATGAGSFTYNWLPSGGTSAAATGLAAGNYTVTATDPAGCVATRTVAITQPAAITTTIGAVNNVTCNGLNNGSATVNASGGTGAFTYTWAPAGGTAATATNLGAGNYTVSVKDANNCNVTNTLTITEPAAIDASVTQNGSVLTANATGATYQWVNCAGNTPVAGQTAQNFTVASNGSYKVIVTVGGCSVTSACVTLSATGLNEQGAISGLQLYPNPGTGVYTLTLSDHADVIVSNVIGEIVLKESVTKGNNTLNLEKQPNGIYTVNIISGGRSTAVKLIKQ